jgi:transcriptional regulator with XRE-family HTH domain
MNKRLPEHSERISIETADALAAIGNRIRDLRGQKGLTLQALSEQTGLSPSMLSLVERGQTSPSIGTLVVISSALGVHMSDLLAVEDRTARDPVSRASEQPILRDGTRGPAAHPAGGPDARSRNGDQRVRAGHRQRRAAGSSRRP